MCIHLYLDVFPLPVSQVTFFLHSHITSLVIVESSVLSMCLSFSTFTRTSNSTVTQCSKCDSIPNLMQATQTAYSGWMFFSSALFGWSCTGYVGIIRVLGAFFDHVNSAFGNFRAVLWHRASVTRVSSDTRARRVSSVDAWFPPSVFKRPVGLSKVLSILQHWTLSGQLFPSAPAAHPQPKSLHGAWWHKWWLASHNS